ncbi:hypothetical protein [Halosolutus gelatinilyticus]|uniref:hypothetical protein n=1 Tax=Halosolutus gelatinilyticus TaxID=2931975 RepID=UPI001FF4C25D|nr:hypothetical protein [Halosolutus gelatinilyticus]
MTFNKNRFVIKKAYESPDLKERKGSTTFTKKKRIDRPAPKEDDLPLRGKRTTTEPWHTYMATESEWKTISQRRRMTIGQEDVSAQHSHPPEEDEHCGIGVWDYEQDGEDYYVKSPMNIVCKGYDVEDVEDIIDDEGWYDEDDYSLSWKRYAWDTDRELFVGPDNEPQGEYSHAVNKRVGWLGRKHAKFWELEDGIVTIQAHEDGSFDHSTGLEYDPGREAIVDILTSNGGSYDGTTYLNNSKKDHSGYATVIEGDFDSINRSC